MHAKTAIQRTVSKEGSPEGACLPQQKHGRFRQEDLQPTRAMEGERGVPEGESLLRCPLYCGGQQGWHKSVPERECLARKKPDM